MSGRSLIVQKYGGTSLATPDLLERAAERIIRTSQAGHSVAVVLSAMGDATDRLLDRAREIQPEPDPRELDALLASGEQVSVALMSMALKRRGADARSYLGWQVPIRTGRTPGRARITEVVTDRIAADLAAGTVAVVAGFQGVDEAGNLTTLGRGGSDTTAVALAVALGADECQILSDVDGVFTADPALVPEARLLDRVTFEEILELASLGSRVLQLRAVEVAGKHNLPLRVMHAHGAGAGTLISYEEPGMEAPVVSGIAVHRDEAEITVTNVPDRPGMAHQILEPVSRAGIEVDMIVLNAPREGRVDFSFTVDRGNFDRARAAVADSIRDVVDARVTGNDRVAKISVVGVGMRPHAGIATRLFAALAAEGINVRLVATSEIKVSVLVDERYLELGVRCLHEAFDLAQSSP